MRGECMVGHMCTYRRIFGAEPLRAPQVFEHATLSPTITFHSNAPSTRLLLNRLLTSAGEQRQLPLWRRVLCPKVGAQASGWVWRGAIFMCLLVHRLRVECRNAKRSTARSPSTMPPLPLLAIGSGLVAKMLLSHDMRYTATGITERDDRCGTRPSGELRSPTPAAAATALEISSTLTAMHVEFNQISK